MQITIHELAPIHDLTFGTSYTILTDDLGMVKKAARWVLKLLSTSQKPEGLEGSAAAASWTSSAGLIGSPEQYSDNGRICCVLPYLRNQKQSMQQVKKGQPGPVKAEST